MSVLDTTFLSDYLQGKKGATQVHDEMLGAGETFRIPAAVWVETLHALSPSVRAKAASALESSAIFEPFTRELADAAARLQHELRREGRPLGWHDLQIAATALHYNEAVVSNDEGFDAVAGLERRSH